MTKTTKDFLNQIIEKEKQVMFLFWAGRVYLLRDHYKHLDPEDAQKILLGNYPYRPQLTARKSNRIPGAWLVYLTDPI